MKKFKERLKELRSACGISQKEIAEKLGITRSAYANYEQGTREPDFETLKKICFLFDCTSDYLIGKDEF